MNATVLLVSMLVPLAVFVMWPLFTADPEDSLAAPEEDPTASLELRKNNAYAALKEAEFDRRTGKLSDEDYDKVVGRYKNQALEAIAALDARQGAAAPPATTSGKARFCAHCGTAIAGGSKFCAGCGAKLAA